MEYENMRVTELKALARDRGLRNYSQMRKAELVALLHQLQLPAPGLLIQIGLHHLHQLKLGNL